MHKMELKVSDSMIKNKIKIKFKQDYRSWEFCSFNSSSSDKREPFSKLTYLQLQKPCGMLMSCKDACAAPPKIYDHQ